MALTGDEILFVQGVDATGAPAATLEQTTTQAIANLSPADLTKGSFTANGASAVTVADTAVTADSIITFTLKTVGGTVGAYPAIKTITPSTGFTVAATASDTSVYNYQIEG